MGYLVSNVLRIFLEKFPYTKGTSERKYKGKRNIGDNEQESFEEKIITIFLTVLLLSIIEI